jgi:hypothetical protein
MSKWPTRTCGRHAPMQARMNKKSSKCAWLAFAASFLAVGIPYWFIPYSKITLPDALLTPALIAVFAGALVLRALRAASFGRAVGIVGAAVPAAVFARVVFDGLKDPTSHNLWPFELIIASLVGFTCALAGAAVGSLIGAVWAKRSHGAS